MKIACLWSGGKDSCLAVYKAKNAGHDIVALFNFINMEGKESLSHGLTGGIIRRQAELTGLPFLQIAMPVKDYRENFKALINEWKAKSGIEAVVFGDIYLEEHRAWIDSVCKEAGVQPILPLWGQNTGALINEFIEAGFKALIVSVKPEALDKIWLGREIDFKFVDEIMAMGNIDLCGEKGEFHTFVYAGPLFKRPVNFRKRKTVLKNKHWFLEIG